MEASNVLMGEVMLPDHPQDAHSGTYAAMRAAVDVQISTAKKYPRNLAVVGQALGRYVTADEQTAQSCIYSLRRGGKTIRGPSIRFAEILAYAWGHMRIDARVVDEGKDFIVVRGEAHDLQTNNSWAQDVTRRIVGGEGKRYDVDLIQVTTMAAASIAQRDSVLKAIPAFIWRPAFDECVRRIAGDVKTLSDRRIKAIGQFSLVGVTPEMIFKKLGVSDINGVTGEHLVDLIGTFQAIRDGQTTVEAEFGDSRITSRSLGGSPLSAQEDVGTGPEVQAGPVDTPRDEAANPVPNAPSAPLERKQREEAPPAPEPEKSPPPVAAAVGRPAPKAGPAPKEEIGAVFVGAETPVNMSTGKPAAAPLTPWGEAIRRYEMDCRSAKTPQALKKVAMAWGASEAFSNLTEGQKQRVDDIWDAAGKALGAQAADQSAARSRQAYEAAKGPPEPPPQPSQPIATSEHPIYAELEDVRPRDPSVEKLWRECVDYLLAGANNADVVERMTQLKKDGRLGKLPEDDQIQMRTASFRIRKTKPL